MYFFKLLCEGKLIVFPVPKKNEKHVLIALPPRSPYAVFGQAAQTGAASPEVPWAVAAPIVDRFIADVTCGGGPVWQVAKPVEIAGYGPAQGSAALF